MQSVALPCTRTVEPPNKGHFRSGGLILSLYGGCPLVGGWLLIILVLACALCAYDHLYTCITSLEKSPLHCNLCVFGPCYGATLLLGSVTSFVTVHTMITLSHSI